MKALKILLVQSMFFASKLNNTINYGIYQGYSMTRENGFCLLLKGSPCRTGTFSCKPVCEDFRAAAEEMW